MKILIILLLRIYLETELKHLEELQDANNTGSRMGTWCPHISQEPSSVNANPFTNQECVWFQSSLPWYSKLEIEIAAESI